jgi:hypothetical protein
LSAVEIEQRPSVSIVGLVCLSVDVDRRTLVEAADQDYEGLTSDGDVLFSGRREIL